MNEPTKKPAGGGGLHPDGAGGAAVYPQYTTPAPRLQALRRVIEPTIDQARALFQATGDSRHAIIHAHLLELYFCGGALWPSE